MNSHLPHAHYKYDMIHQNAPRFFILRTPMDFLTFFSASSRNITPAVVVLMHVLIIGPPQMREFIRTEIIPSIKSNYNVINAWFFDEGPEAAALRDEWTIGTSIGKCDALLIVPGKLGEDCDFYEDTTAWTWYTMERSIETIIFRWPHLAITNIDDRVWHVEDLSALISSLEKIAINTRPNYYRQIGPNAVPTGARQF
jgi:hypothetical protein